MLVGEGQVSFFTKTLVLVGEGQVSFFTKTLRLSICQFN